MTFTIRRLLFVVFGLACVPSFLVSRLQAQYAAPPQTYSLTETQAMLPEGSILKIYRDGSKVLTDMSYPPMAEKPKGFHVRTLHDLQAKTQYTWDLIDASVPCGAATFSGAWEDPFAYFRVTTADLAKQNAKLLRKETLSGIPMKVFEIADPKDGKGKRKLWVEEKYGLVVKQEVSENGQAQAGMWEIKDLSLAKPSASLFVLPAACTNTEITAHVSSSGGHAHSEASIGIPQTSASQKEMPLNSPSPESASQIGVPTGTNVSAQYEDGTEVKLKAEEQVALLFMLDIQDMEEGEVHSMLHVPRGSGCSGELGRICSLDELVKGVKGKDRRVIGFSRNPDQDPNYSYTVKILDDKYFQAAAVPRRTGLGGFFYHSVFGALYYNPNGTAAKDDKALSPVIDVTGGTFRRE